MKQNKQPANKMTSTERRATISIALIISLRMIGLFMVLPLFTLYALSLKGATPTLIGLAIGGYGLAQALFQIPFGYLSDRFGRKSIILFGLLIFGAGSLLAGMATSVSVLILGRTLQGVGAIGGTTLALLSDLTRDNQRTKAMAIAGMTIGLSFSIAMILGPVLANWLAVNELFYFAAGFTIIAITLLYTVVPQPQAVTTTHPTTTASTLLRQALSEQLLPLYLGIFLLHAIFTASFIVIPVSLSHFLALSASEQWKLYVPTLLIAFITSLMLIGIAESKRRIKPFLLLAIGLLATSEYLFLHFANYTYAVSALFLFFTGFSTLEAFMPSLVSRTVPPQCKGGAMGIYSCAQFSGIFVGGVLGGWLYGHHGMFGVYSSCIIAAVLWFLLMAFLHAPKLRSSQPNLT